MAKRNIKSTVKHFVFNKPVSKDSIDLTCLDLEAVCRTLPGVSIVEHINVEYEIEEETNYVRPKGVPMRGQEGCYRCAKHAASL